MVTRKSPWAWISLPVGGVVAGALGVLFIVRGLEQADQLASIVGAFIALAGLGVSVSGLILTRRSATPSPPSSPATAPPSAQDAITASGERSVAVRHNSGVIQTGDAGQTAITGASDTRNTIQGGIFHGPVTMARDITNLPAAQPSPPSPRPDGPDAPECQR